MRMAHSARTSVLVVLVAAFLVTSPALAAQEGDETASHPDPRDIVGEAAVSLADAVSAALAARPGHAVEADLEAEIGDRGREVFFEIMVVGDSGALYEVIVDPVTGAVRSAEESDEEELDELPGFQEALRYSERSLAELVASAEELVKGTPVGAELELEGTSPQADVLIASGRYLVEVEVEGRAAQVTGIELEGMGAEDGRGARR